jgi:hypothetical protein
VVVWFASEESNLWVVRVDFGSSASFSQQRHHQQAPWNVRATECARRGRCKCTDNMKFREQNDAHDT